MKKSKDVYQPKKLTWASHLRRLDEATSEQRERNEELADDAGRYLAMIRGLVDDLESNRCSSVALGEVRTMGMLEWVISGNPARLKLSPNQSGTESDEAKEKPSRVSWERHLQLKEKAIIDLRSTNEELDEVVELCVFMAARLAFDLDCQNVRSDHLNEVKTLGWLDLPIESFVQWRVDFRLLDEQFATLSIFVVGCDSLSKSCVVEMAKRRLFRLGISNVELTQIHINMQEP